MAFTPVNDGDLAVAPQVQQIIDALSGVTGAGQPISMTTLESATDYALAVKNLGTGGLGLHVYSSAGADLFDSRDASTSIDNGTLFVDHANNRVGINDTTPTATLDITGSLAVSGAATFGSITSIGLGNGALATPSLYFADQVTTGIYKPATHSVAIVSNSVTRLTADTSGVTVDTILVPVDGSSGATDPEYSFVGDTNTGMYSSAADTLDFATGGTNRISVSSAGVVTLANGLTVSAGSVSLPTGSIASAALATTLDGKTLTTATLTTPTINGATLTGTLDGGTFTGSTLTSPALTTPTISTLTTAGDTLYSSGSGVLVRLPKGTARQMLQQNTDLTAPEWVASPASLMTAQGDLLYASAANTPAALPAGTSGQALSVSGGVPAWSSSLTLSSILNAAGEIGVRFRGTVDQTVTGTWTATNGSPNVTASGDLTDSIRRWQAVKIGATTFFVTSVTFATGTTTLVLDANYTGTTGTVTLLEDDIEALDLKDGDGNILASFRTNGDVLFGPNAGVTLAHNQDDSDDAMVPVDFWYDAVHRRPHCRTLMVTDVGDTPEIAIRRAGGTYPDGPLSAILLDETIGMIHWAGWNGTGFAHRAAQIHITATQDIVPGSTGGRMVFGTTPNGGTETTAQWAINHDGELQGRNGIRLSWRNAANSAYLRSIDVDSGDNLNIGKDDSLADIQMFNRLAMYTSAGAGAASALFDPSLGLLLPAVDPPTANYATKRSIISAMATVTTLSATPTLAGDYNCASVTDNGPGDYTITWDTDFADVNYAVVATVCDGSNRFKATVLEKLVGSVRIQVTPAATDTLTDPSGAGNCLMVIASGLQ